MSETQASPERQPLRYEDAIRELEDVVRRLESPDITLDEAMAAFMRGTELAKVCSDRLAEIEAKITALTTRSDGSVMEVPFGTGEPDGT